MSTQSTHMKLSAGVLIALILVLTSLGGMGVHAATVLQSTATMAATEEPCPKPAGVSTLKATLTEYTLPSANSQPFGIAAGPDGALLHHGEGHFRRCLAPAAVSSPEPLPAILRHGRR